MEQVYQKLAQRLNTIPNGFPATESGIELKVLAKIFTPEEAALGAEMRLQFELSETIAARAGVSAEEAYRTLKGMARQGMIRVRRGDGGLAFALMPFVVGFYEEQLPRLDAELAQLVEQYFQEVSGHTLLDTTPPIHRVVPVGEAVPFDLEVFPHEEAVAIVEMAKSWGVRDCICRVQKHLIGEGCDYPVEACLVLAPVEGLFAEGGVTKPITKEEALQLIRDVEEAGLIHTTGNYRDGLHYICNCCPCCCGVLRGVTEFGVPAAVASSGFLAVVDEEECTACGVCVDRCHFDAITVPDDVAVVNADRCVGCGVCTPTCPVEAIHLERRTDAKEESLSANIGEWMERRAASRGLQVDGS